MRLSGKSGATLAAAAAALMLSGAPMGSTVQAAEEAKVQCFGVNSCKGTSECKTAKNECKGKNACKGQGFVSLTKADCEAKGGKLSES